MAPETDLHHDLEQDTEVVPSAPTPSHRAVLMHNLAHRLEEFAYLMAKEDVGPLIAPGALIGLGAELGQAGNLVRSYGFKTPDPRPGPLASADCVMWLQEWAQVLRVAAAFDRWLSDDPAAHYAGMSLQ
ncbi:hypothetical protein [Devosia sp. RR2S18]|uniref:hypothetical protein n=1 Tax=Devosia rhizosphaerae TaxID=3049774 RepID=UPI00253FAD18|nr:hypothetical protein [Devosia sp. RR2S18]WIJ26600.1 hypothetical protein QOV41_07570 [Devosia sp. RR2S18]